MPLGGSLRPVRGASRRVTLTPPRASLSTSRQARVMTPVTPAMPPVGSPLGATGRHARTGSAINCLASGDERHISSVTCDAAQSVGRHADEALQRWYSAHAAANSAPAAGRKGPKWRRSVEE